MDLKNHQKDILQLMGNPSWFIIPAKLESVLRDRAIELNEREGKQSHQSF